MRICAKIRQFLFMTKLSQEKVQKSVYFGRKYELMLLIALIFEEIFAS